MSEAENDNKAGNDNGEGVVNPIDEVTRLTEVELLKFNHMRLQVEHHQQSIRVLQLEHEQANREFIAATHQRNLSIEKHQNTSERLDQEYKAFVRTLSDKYGVPAQYMGIDDETGVVREMPRPPEPEEKPPAEEPPTTN
jgi:hypothetical protein